MNRPHVYPGGYSYQNAIGIHFNYDDVRENFKEVNGVMDSNLNSAVSSAQTQTGSILALATGNLSIADNQDGILMDVGNTVINQADPGILKAFELMSAALENTSVKALDEAGAATGTAGALTAAALKQAADLQKAATKTPLQDFLPVIIVGVVFVGVVLYFTIKD